MEWWKWKGMCWKLTACDDQNIRSKRHSWQKGETLSSVGCGVSLGLDTSRDSVWDRVLRGPWDLPWFSVKLIPHWSIWRMSGRAGWPNKEILCVNNYCVERLQQDFLWRGETYLGGHWCRLGVPQIPSRGGLRLDLLAPCTITRSCTTVSLHHLSKGHALQQHFKHIAL